MCNMSKVHETQHSKGATILCCLKRTQNKPLSYTTEDPYLGARLARAFVRGVQGEGIMAVIKHWAFNEQETARNTESSQVDSRTAWELYYPPFEAAVEEGAAAFMCAYNKVNGTWCCENEVYCTRLD